MKINLEGSVALVHEHGVPEVDDTSKWAVAQLMKAWKYD